MKVCCLQQKTPYFGAKRNAIWCKMQCDLVQIAVQFGAKCRTK